MLLGAFSRLWAAVRQDSVRKVHRPESSRPRLALALLHAPTQSPQRLIIYFLRIIIHYHISTPTLLSYSIHSLSHDHHQSLILALFKLCATKKRKGSASGQTTTLAFF